MPIKTNLNIYPYFDDYDPTKDYYRFLFEPGQSVQTRELIQLQTVIQAQIERFGDSIFKRGTIVEGCNFVFTPSYPYAKLRDLQTDGTQTIPSSLVGMFATNPSGLKAFVVNYQDGFEASDPNLKTLYLRYINSGTSGSVYQFSPADTLTVTDANSSLSRVVINNGGLSFSNTDTLVVVPALVVNVSTGTFTNGQYVSQPAVGSNLQIIWIDSTSLALTNQVILGLQPRVVDLANATVNTSVWSVVNSSSIINSGNTAAGQVEGVLGLGAQGGVITDSSGRITSVLLSSQGSGYANVPFVTMKSANNTSGITAVSLTGLNYRAKVIVASNTNSVGNGYAFGVTSGIIYQRGYFLRVAPQTVLVSKYDQVPNNVVAGFNSIESIVDQTIDPSLNDPLTGNNYNAPGANRLQIVPTLTAAPANAYAQADDFFPIVTWSEGNATKVNQTSDYSQLGDELAQMVEDQDGDFVVDRFQVTTRSPSNSSIEGTSMDVVIDPGLGYVQGYRVQTVRNQVITVNKGTDNLVTNTSTIPLTYGSYVRVQNIGGSFQFQTGDVVSLRDTAGAFMVNDSSTITAPGNQIGTARVRSLTYESGVPGTPSAVYRLWLFNISMAQGNNFRKVRSIYYGGTNVGIADPVLQLDPSSAANVAVLVNPNSSALLFDSGAVSLKNINAATYVYRTNYQLATVANTGLLTQSLAANPNEFFTYIGQLPDAQAQLMYIVPIGGDLKFVNTINGTLSTNTTSPNVVGTSTTFISDVQAGDWIVLTGNTTQTDRARVTAVVNNTLMILDANCAFVNAAAVANRVYPQNYAVPFGNRSGLVANVSANGNLLTLNFGTTFTFTGTVNVALSYDVSRQNVLPIAKSANRDRFVKLNLANVAGGATGPWCLGIPDCFRLKAVYVDTSNAVSTNTSMNAADDFVIDSNQNPDYLDLSYLKQIPASNLVLTTSNWLLVQLDHFTTPSVGYAATPTYVSANAAQVQAVDSLPLANLGTNISTLEIPEVFSSQGDEYDLTQMIDFRPIAVNTAVSVTDSTVCTINPSNVTSFGNTSNVAGTDRKFPSPGALFTYTSDQYLGRKDAVVMGKDGNISVLRGIPAVDPARRYAPATPTGTMLLDVVAVPPYPTLPANYSNTLADILRTRLVNERLSLARTSRRTADHILATDQLNDAQPMRYTQRSLGSIDRRVSALEYYASLNFLETDVKDRVIPSSANGAINRFKFGFFVDGFTDLSLEEISNPQFSADIESGKLVPQKLTFGVRHDPGAVQYPPYVDYPIVLQTYATGTPSNACVSNTTVSTAILLEDDDTFQKANSKWIDVTPAATPITMGNAVGTATLYFDSSTTVLFQIYLGNTVFKTGNDSVVMTTSEKTLMKQATFSDWFLPYPLNDRVIGANNYTTGAGKITWTHNPAAGLNYTVLVTPSQSGLPDWRYAIQYPTSTQTVSCPTTPTPGNVAPISYTGVMSIVSLYSDYNRSTGGHGVGDEPGGQGSAGSGGYGTSAGGSGNGWGGH